MAGTASRSLLDMLTGTAGRDVLIGGGGGEFISGGEGDDLILAGGGDDTIGGDNIVPPGEVSPWGPTPPGETPESPPGRGAFPGVVGDNVILAGAGNDSVTAGFGSDVVFGGAGADTIEGYGEVFPFSRIPNAWINLDAPDLLFGDAGDDLLRGGGGNDLLDGGSGNDRLEGGVGADFLRGGSGEDVFVAGWIFTGQFVPETEVGPGRRDVILDFQQGHDRIDLSGFNVPAQGQPPPLFLGTDPFVASWAVQLRYQFEGGRTILQLVAAPIGGPPADGTPPTIPEAPTAEIELLGVHRLEASDVILM